MMEMPYSDPAAARLLASRAALAVQKQAAFLARTDLDTDEPGNLTGLASHLMEAARALMDHAIAADMLKGDSWADIGDALGVSRQAAHARHAKPVQQIRTEMAEGWMRDALAGESSQWVSPHAARLLDDQTRRVLAALDVPESRIPAEPVSGGQPRMDRGWFKLRLEHAERLLAIAEAEAAADPDAEDDSWQLRRMRYAVAIRRVQYYELLQAEEEAAPGSAGIAPPLLADLLDAARKHRHDLGWAGHERRPC